MRRRPSISHVVAIVGMVLQFSAGVVLACDGGCAMGAPPADAIVAACCCDTDCGTQWLSDEAATPVPVDALDGPVLSHRPATLHRPSYGATHPTVPVDRRRTPSPDLIRLHQSFRL